MGTVKRNSGKSHLGTALRQLRRKHGWTLTDVSRRTGFSVPTLSKVENDRVSLSYDKLIQLSEGLDIDIAQLFSTVGDGDGSAPVAITGRRSVNRGSEGEVVPTRNYVYRYLNADVVHKRFIPIVTDVCAQSLQEFGPLVKHSGDEFVYVLTGEVEVHTELYAPFVLHPGESAYLDSGMGHAYLKRGSGPCQMLAICSASEAQLREALMSEVQLEQRRNRQPARRRKPPRAQPAR